MGPKTRRLSQTFTVPTDEPGAKGRDQEPNEDMVDILEKGEFVHGAIVTTKKTLERQQILPPIKTDGRRLLIVFQKFIGRQRSLSRSKTAFL
jgi:hypothetical protein